MYTHIVVGAGSAGCVIAARLSENPDFNILLVEAGPDYPDADKLPADLEAAIVPSGRAHDWGIEAYGTGERVLSMLRGKVVGGSSAINACIALRSEPGDFEAWQGSGALDWSWSSVLPYYKKLETDLDYPESEFHGSNGPLPIRRWKQPELHPLAAALVEACSAAGYRVITDQNIPGSTGCGPLPMNAIEGRRISAAEGYLGPVRSRGNLTIVSDVLVDRILFAGKKAVGVSTVSPDRTREFRGGTIILSAGAYGTPAILLRSGIGAAKDLHALNIPVIADLPGVGDNLSDHTQVPIKLIARNTTAPSVKTPCIQAILKYSSKDSKQTNDMHVCLLVEVDAAKYTPYTGKSSHSSLFYLTSNLMLPQSRGRVRLKSTDPNNNPNVEINFCAAEADVRRHRDGLRLAASFLKQPAFVRLESEILEPASIFENDDELDRYILDRIETAHHPSGTARMGSSADHMAVVGTDCGVFGVDGLFVADASIIPVPVRVNTNLTCIMIGERVSAELANSVNKR